MPRIPFDLAQVPDVNARSIGGQVGEGPVVGNRQLGGALGGISDALGQGARVADDYAMGEARQNAASLTAAHSFTSKYSALQDATSPGAPGFTEQVSQAYDQHVSDVTGVIEDPMVRMAVRQNFQAQKATWLNQADTFQRTANAQNQRDVASIGLNQAINDVTSSPTPQQYALSTANALRVMGNMQGVGGTERAHQQLQALHAVTKGYLSGLYTNIDSPAALSRFNQVMNTPGIKDALEPGAYENFQRTAASLGRSYTRQAGQELTQKVSDLNKAFDDGVDISPDDINAVQSDAGIMTNTVAARGLADLKTKLSVKQTHANDTIPDLRNAISAAQHGTSLPGDPSYAAGFPPDLGDDLRAASGASGRSLSFLAGIGHMESGSQLLNGGAVITPPNGGSARGATQFLPGTWLDVVRSNPDAIGAALKDQHTGAQISAMSDAELLALRDNRRASLVAAGLYANQNTPILRAALGHDPTDTELYVAHVLGPQGAVRFLTTVQNNPQSSASAAVGQAVAQANSGLFMDKSGRDVSAQEALNRIDERFTHNAVRVSAVQVETLATLLKQREESYRRDPVSAGMQAGAIDRQSLIGADPSAWQKRAASVSAWAARQGTVDSKGALLPTPRPFTNAEVEQYHSMLNDPDVPTDQVVSLARSMQSFRDPVMIRAGLAQLAEKKPLVGWMGQLVDATKDSGVARDIWEGSKHLNRNTDLPAQLGIKAGNVSGPISSTLGHALAWMPSTLSGGDYMAEAVNAATAHYVQQVYGHGSGAIQTEFSPSKFSSSLQAVLGGTPGHDAIQNVNREPTLMPEGVNARDVENFLHNARPADLARISYDGRPPHYPDIPGHPSVPIPMDQIRYAKLRAFGGGYYALATGPDNRPALSPGANGVAPIYLMKLTADTINQGATGRRLSPVAPSGAGNGQ